MMATMLWTYHFRLPSCKRVQEFWVFAKFCWWKCKVNLLCSKAYMYNVSFCLLSMKAHVSG